MNQIVTSAGNIVATQLQEAAKAKAIEYLTSMGLQLPQAQKEQFIELCSAMNLNPFKREIYAVGFKGNFNIIVGYEVYLKKADATNKCAGWNVRTEGSIEKGNLKAIIEIHRKDYTQPFVHEVDYDEYKQEYYKDGKLVKSFWQTKPKTMIKKVAMAQGFRLAFPNDFQDMPYIEEEVQQVIEDGGINLPAEKSFNELNSTLAPLGIKIELKGNMAIASGSAVFSNNALLKELGFAYDKTLKSWRHYNVKNDDVVDAEVVQNTQDEHKTMLKTLEDVKSYEELEGYLKSLKLEISDVKANGNGVYFAKIDGDSENVIGELLALGSQEKNGSWILNIDKLYKEHLSVTEAANSLF